jgi:hypothetical protein
MTIKSEIKKDRMKVFRRIYIKRRETTGEYETDWVELDPTTIKTFGTISYSVDDVLPNFYKFSGLTFSVLNNDGQYSDITDDKSIFYQKLTRFRSLIKVEAGYENPDTGAELPTTPTLFVGISSEDAPYTENNIVNFKTKHISSIFDEFPADRITGLNSTLTAQGIVEKIRDHEDSNGVKIFQKYFTIGAWNIQTTTNNYAMVTGTDLQGISCWKLMQKLAAAENYVVYVDRIGDFYFEDRANITTTVEYHFSGLNDTDKTFGHNMIGNISVDENIRKVFNRVKIQFEKEDTTTSFIIRNESWDWGDSSSSFLYGVREYSYKNTWLDQTTASTVAGTIYDEFLNPKDEVKFKSKFVPQLMVQDRVSVTYRTERIQGDYLWGYFNWGSGIWGESFGYNIDLNNDEFQITNLMHNIDQFTSSLVLREI